MTYNELKSEENKYVMNTYGRFPIALDHGEGATLWDVEGKKYIDLASGIGVNCLGYANPPFHGGIQSRLPCKCKKTQDMRAQRGHSRARIAPAFFYKKKGILCARQGGRAKSRIGRIRAIGSVRPSRPKAWFRTNYLIVIT